MFYLHIASVKFDDEANIFHGEVNNTRDVITFEGTSVKELKEAFKESVEDYLAFCKGRGEDPEKPFSGRFIVRLSPRQHRKIYVAARQSGKSMNAWIAKHLLSSAEG